jgi:hypothetical protein
MVAERNAKVSSSEFGMSLSKVLVKMLTRIGKGSSFGVLPPK